MHQVTYAWQRVPWPLTRKTFDVERLRHDWSLELVAYPAANNHGLPGQDRTQVLSSFKKWRCSVYRRNHGPRLAVSHLNDRRRQRVTGSFPSASWPGSVVESQHHWCRHGPLFHRRRHRMITTLRSPVHAPGLITRPVKRTCFYPHNGIQTNSLALIAAHQCV